jgi:hypothetical protein
MSWMIEENDMYAGVDQSVVAAAKAERAEMLKSIFARLFARKHGVPAQA